MHNNFLIFKFHVYLILYTRLFMKLNLFEILLYGTFITAEISRSTVFFFMFQFSVSLLYRLMCCCTWTADWMTCSLVKLYPSLTTFAGSGTYLLEIISNPSEAV